MIGDEPPDLRPLARYLKVAGIPVASLRPVDPAHDRGEPWLLPARPETCRFQSARAAALLADAVISDRRRVLSCGAWLEGEAGLPSCLATHPVIVGARGVEEIFPVALTLEERSFLQAASATIEASALP